MSEYIITSKELERLEIPTMFTEQEIVRCRDCKHYDLPYCKKGECTYCSERQITDPDGYCFRGERRGE